MLLLCVQHQSARIPSNCYAVMAPEDQLMNTGHVCGELCHPMQL